MRALFIGGTGILSSACAELAIKRGWELYTLRRGISGKHPVAAGAKTIQADIHAPLDTVRSQLGDLTFDVVVDYIAFKPAHLERDIALFRGRTKQFMFISSASAYQKPPTHYVITEQTPLENPFWEYSRDKKACEELLMKSYRDEGFPAVVIRPSHTYSAAYLPFSVDSGNHPYTVVRRMRQGKKVIVPGDGTSLWTLTWNGDFAKGLVGLMGNKNAIGEVFHITSDEALTWDQIIQEAGRAAGAEPNIIHIPSDWLAAYDPDMIGTLIGDKANCAVFDNSKIKRFVPGYSADVKWSEGARRVMAWLDADPARQSIDAQADKTWDEMIARYESAWPGK